MNIIHVVPALSEESSGPSYSVVGLCHSLTDSVNHLKLAALDWAPLRNPPPFLKVFPIGLGPRRLGRSPVMLNWLREQCAGTYVDVIHNHGMWQMNSVYPAWACMNTNVKLIYSPRGTFSCWAMRHGSFAKKLFWPLFQLKALRSAHCFHATAESEYHDIRRLGFRQPVAVIPIGIDLARIQISKGFQRTRTLLFLGRIHPVKGLDILLPAWQAVQDHYPEWVLKIVGSDDGYHGCSGYLEDVRRYASKLGLKRVYFVGSLYGEDKFKAYREADLYVLPSYSENFAITVAEALSMETPSIVSKAAPWSGLEACGAGWWIDIGVEPLAECLSDALSRSPNDLNAMGRRGRDWMQQDFSWQSIGAKMNKTYQWLCNQSLPVPPWVRLD